MKILIPTDFSIYSKAAVKYAVEMSADLNAELLLFHVIHVETANHAILNIQKLEDKMAEVAETTCVSMITDLEKESKHPPVINYAVVKSPQVHESIICYARQMKADLIVMGTKGAGGLKKVLLGSNAAAVINKSFIPVLVIPELAKFHKIRRIAYASDILNTGQELTRLVSLARIFNASIYIIHIKDPGSEIAIDVELMKKNYKRKLKYHKINFHIVANDDIIKGIDNYIAVIQADMVAMFTHKLGFFERLFLLSTTREMAFHNRVPLLTYKKE